MQPIYKALLLKMEVNMNTLAKINEKENERTMDIIEDINALKVLVQTLSTNNELYNENSEMYEKIKNDLKASMLAYRAAWDEIIQKYELDPEKGDNYVLNFNNRSVHYVENQ